MFLLFAEREIHYLFFVSLRIACGFMLNCDLLLTPLLDSTLKLQFDVYILLVLHDSLLFHGNAFG